MARCDVSAKMTLEKCLLMKQKYTSCANCTIDMSAPVSTPPKMQGIRSYPEAPPKNINLQTGLKPEVYARIRRAAIEENISIPAAIVMTLNEVWGCVIKKELNQ